MGIHLKKQVLVLILNCSNIGSGSIYNAVMEGMREGDASLLNTKFNKNMFMIIIIIIEYFQNSLYMEIIQCRFILY